MYIITSGMSPEEEYLAHYGVLGMKWHVHKAKQYRAKGDIVRKKQSDLYNEARDKRAEAEYQKQNHNTVTAKRYKKEARDIEKTADKLNKILDKLDKKQNKHNDKNKKAIDEKVEKMKQSEKYQDLQRSVDRNNENAKSFKDKIDKKLYDRDFDKMYQQESNRLQEEAYGDAMKESSKIENKLKKDNPGIQGKAFDDLLDAAIMDRADQLHIEKLQEYVNSDAHKQRVYEGMMESNNYWTNQYNNQMQDMEDKTRKKYRKYVIHTYGVSENELYHHGIKKKNEVTNMVIKTYGLAEDELMHYGVLGMKWGHRKAVRSYMEYQNHASRHESLLNKSRIAESKGNAKKAAKLKDKAGTHESKAWKALAKTHDQLETNKTKIKDKYGKKINKLQAKDMASATIQQSTKYQEKAVKYLNKMGLNLASYANDKTMDADAKLLRAQDKAKRDNYMFGPIASARHIPEINEAQKERQSIINDSYNPVSRDDVLNKKKKKH